MTGTDWVTELHVQSGNSIKSVLEIFATVPYGSLPVADDRGKYLGVIRLRDLLLLDSGLLAAPVLPYVTSCVPLLDTENPLTMQWISNCDILPVITKKNKLKGFIPKDLVLSEKVERYSKLANKYLQVLNSAYNGLLAVNSEGQIFVCNPVAERLLGLKSCEIYGRKCAEVVPGLGMERVLAKGEPQLGVKLATGEHSIVAHLTPLFHEGNCLGALAVLEDVSEKERIYREIFANKELAKELNAIFESSYDGLYICDRTGKVTRVNTAWEKICGFRREMVMGKTAQELVAQGYYDKSAALLALNNKTVSTTMLKITSGPKTGQFIMATATPIFDEQGELCQVVVNVRDITELENLKSQLYESMELSRKYADELEEIRIQTYRTENFVAKSPAMQRIMDLVVRIAKVDSLVLLTGESGIGKEVVAKKIHQLSRRKNNSLIKINCGAIPENLLESELFGYEPGAFTGAKRDGKPGMFEMASGGTLFLDEIGDLPLSLQVKLLRALQEKEIIRVGGLKPIKVDTRIIAATNKDLYKMVSEGTFREDLFYRLNVVNIEIPPLRERKEDLIPLISCILRNLNNKYGMNKRLSPQVVNSLLAYNWPGNIRELENTLERLVVLTSEDEIRQEHLPDYLQNQQYPKAGEGITTLKDAVASVECKLLREAYRKYGTTRAMAKALAVNQSTIVRKMRQYGLEHSDDSGHQPVAYQHLYRI